jgi:hypothetical protein
VIAREPIRDPIADHLLTPQNAAMFVIDYQPSQFAGVRSIDRDLLLESRPISWVALAVELQRDRAREETLADVVEIVLTERLLQG